MVLRLKKEKRSLYRHHIIPIAFTRCATYASSSRAMNTRWFDGALFLCHRHQFSEVLYLPYVQISLMKGGKLFCGVIIMCTPILTSFTSHLPLLKAVSCACVNLWYALLWWSLLLMFLFLGGFLFTFFLKQIIPLTLQDRTKYRIKNGWQNYFI